MSDFNSKVMNRWANLFLLLGVFCVVFELVTGTNLEGTWSIFIIMSIYGVGARILKEIENKD